MTPEMVFESLLVSHDPTVFGIMHRILRDFSIATNICLATSKAVDLLDQGSTDLIVIDWDSDSYVLLDNHSVSRLKQKPTILAVTPDDEIIPGAHVLVRKPLTRESGMKSMRTAYIRMVQDFRKHVRYALMTLVRATDHNNRTLILTVTNIGDGGVGLSTKEKLTVGGLLSFPLVLPGTQRELSIQARVLWTREYGVAGCEFVRIPPVDLQIMLGWLQSRCRIKKPLIGLETPEP